MARTLFHMTITPKPEASHLHNNEHFSKGVCRKLHANEFEYITWKSHLLYKNN